MGRGRDLEKGEKGEKVSEKKIGEEGLFYLKDV